jgi:hypothetical protein
MFLSLCYLAFGPMHCLPLGFEWLQFMEFPRGIMGMNCQRWHSHHHLDNHFFSYIAIQMVVIVATVYVAICSLVITDTEHKTIQEPWS